MRTIPAKVILDDVASTLGWDTEDLGVRQWRDLRDALSAALSEVWGERKVWWPELMRTEYLALADEYSAERIEKVGAYRRGDVVYFADADRYYMAIAAVTTDPPAVWWDGEGWIETLGSWKELSEEYDHATDWAPGEYYDSPTWNTNSVFRHAGKYWLPLASWFSVPSNIGLSPTSAPSYWMELPRFQYILPQVGYGRAPIGTIRRITSSDPRVSGEPGEYEWDKCGGGQWVIYNPRGATRFWVQYRLAVPVLSGDEWDASATYTAAPLDEQIYESVMAPDEEVVTPDQVATPAISPASGTYVGGQEVTITCATDGAEIRYTTDGSSPTAVTGTVYSGPVTLEESATVKAAAFKEGMLGSAVASATYTIQERVATPVLSPASGGFEVSQEITMTCATDGAEIRYTTNGATPTSTTGTVYAAPITITASTTIKAAAFKSGMADSLTVTGSFTRNRRVYWGASASTVLDGAGAKALANSLVATSPGRSYSFSANSPAAYLFLAWPDQWAAQPVAGSGFMSSGFPVAMAGASEGFTGAEDGWNYLTVTVDGETYRLYRLYWPIESALTVVVTAS